MSDLLRTISITKGCEPPIAEAAKFFSFCSCGHCGTKAANHPSLTELALAAKPHRWPDMRREQKALFDACAHELTAAETDILKLLELPDIDTVRRAAITGEKPGAGKFELTRAKEQGLARIIQEWTERLIGTEMADKNTAGLILRKDGDHLSAELPLYQHHALIAYLISAKHAKDDILRHLPKEIDPSLIAMILPDPDERYFKGMVEVGGTRIKAELSRKHLDKVLPGIRQMARDGFWPIDVGLFLHQWIGEGDAWWWLRIARSECILAGNAGFNAMCDANGLRYEKWSSAPNACDICHYLHGRVWRRGEGPEPVSSTHPHCCCSRIALYEAAGRIEEKWTRDPYAAPYSREEIERMRTESWP